MAAINSEHRRDYTTLSAGIKSAAGQCARRPVAGKITYRGYATGGQTKGQRSVGRCGRDSEIGGTKDQGGRTLADTWLFPLGSICASHFYDFATLIWPLSIV
jgi:hypothetical protein